MLAGVDEPTYNNVFAVGLKEIQELGSLDDTAAADYLYRLTSGLDRVSLIDVIREVEAGPRAACWPQRSQRASASRRFRSCWPAATSSRADRRARPQDAPLERRWSRSGQNLIDEAKQLDQQIAEIEAGSHVLRAALDVQGRLEHADRYPAAARAS